MVRENSLNCNQCNTELVLNNNWRNTDKKCSRYICKTCDAIKRHEYYLNNKKHELQKSHKHYLENKQKYSNSEKRYKHSIKGIFATYKKNADNRNLQFNLSITDVGLLVSSPCYYCGKMQTLFNGIDRVDNDKGYNLDNSVSCCKNCNLMKRILSKDVFLSHIKEIYEKWGG